MLGGREKVGEGGVIDVRGGLSSKNKRLSFPFGPEVEGIDGRDTIHEHFIREIPLAIGALGCGLWDGGLILARWFYTSGEDIVSEFLPKKNNENDNETSASASSSDNKKNHRPRILDLGCGVGLGGIMAAHFTPGEVYLTDYIPDALGNAWYNVKLNHIPTNNDPELVPEEVGAKLRSGYNFDIKDRCKVCYLDWDAEFKKSGQQQQQQQQKDEKEEKDEKATDELELPEGVSLFNAEPRSFDILLGAELTYNLLSCKSLAYVVDKYLSEDGVFYEVLSKDRDGVSVFIKLIEEEYGFETIRQDAPQEFVGNYGTRKWSKQEMETYSLYQWRRKKKN